MKKIFFVVIMLLFTSACSILNDETTKPPKEVFTITYALDGGNNNPNNPLSYEELESFSLIDPTKEGYDFLGWTYNEVVEPQKNLTINNMTGNICFSANWKETQYTITYELQKGQCNGLITSYNILSDDIIFPTPTKEGFVFFGWYLNGVKVTKITKGTIGNLTIVANWTSLSHNITYNHNLDNDLTLILNDNSQTPIVQGEGITTNEYISNIGQATIDKDFMQNLVDGEYIFLCLIEGDDEIFKITVENNPYVEKNRASYDGISNNEEYFNKTFSFNGKTYDYYIEDEEELYTFLQYISLVEAPINKEATTEYPNGERMVYCFMQDDYLEEFIVDPMALIRRMLIEIGLPMHPLYSYIRNGNVIGIKFAYPTELNTEKSTTITKQYTDTQGMLIASTRTSNFDGFKINNFSTTEVIDTLYELENLAYGVKPIFNENSQAYEVYSEAKRILNIINDDTMNDYDKVENIYAYLALNITYDTAMITIEESGKYSAFTSYGALIEKLAVCDGMASALKLMCLIEGIEAMEILGIGNGGGHAWNKVCINGIWECIDVTWAKTEIEGKVYVNTSYLFGNESSFIESGHIENGNLVFPYVKKVAAGVDSYFTYYDISDTYDLYVTSIDELKAVLKYGKNNHLGCIQIVYDCDVSLQNALNLATFGLSVNVSCMSNNETVYIIYQ